MFFYVYGPDENGYEAEVLILVLVEYVLLFSGPDEFGHEGEVLILVLVEYVLLSPVVLDDHWTMPKS